MYDREDLSEAGYMLASLFGFIGILVCIVWAVTFSAILFNIMICLFIAFVFFFLSGLILENW